MLENRILTLIGSGKPGDGTIPPSLREPYNTIWNFTELNKNHDRNALPHEGEYKTALLAYNTLSHYPEPPFWPSMFSKLPPDASLKQEPISWVTYNSSASPGDGSAFKIEDVAKFAHADRRNQNGLVIQIRIGSINVTETSSDVIRYSFSSDDSKGYALIKGSWSGDGNPGGWKCTLSLSDGDTVQTSPEFTVPIEEGDLTTDLRMVIYDDKVEARISQPGTLVSDVPISSPIKVYQGAFIGFGGRGDEPGGWDQNYLDWLSIYHGSF